MTSYKPLERFSHAEKSLIQILEDHKKWLTGMGGERAELRRAALSGADLCGVNLVGANLREAELDGACLNRADFSGADLENARLDRASLMGTRLVASNMGLTSLVEAVSQEADFREANFNQATLTRAGLYRVVLRGANLRDASLCGANLVRADLRDAGLPGADLSESVLSGAYLTGANLQGARLAGANLLGADLSRANLHGADLRDAKLSDAMMKGSNLSRADLTGADLNGACIEGADLSGWVVRRTSCTRLIRSDAGEVIGFNPGEFEKKCFQPEKLVELILHIPMTVSAAYIAKFITQSINLAVRSTVVVLKGIEALSTYETRMLLVSLDGDIHEKALKANGSRLEKEINAYFHSHPVRKDHVYLGEMLSGTVNGAIDFRSCRWMLSTPWQINPVMVKEELVEEYREIGRICEALHALVVSVIRSETPSL
jgi:uncharacterized protein YjbI with pentapeptide repeats